MSNIEHDEREDAYEHGYRVGVARERERVVKEGVFKELGEAYFAQRDQLRGAVVRADEAEKAVTLAHHWLNEGSVEQAMRALEDVLHRAGGQ